MMIILSWIGQSAVHSQLIGASGYIIGDNVEIGINDSGHEGAPRLVASNNRSNQALGSPVYFGFVANPQLDGWVNYDGDFFTPGTPENGFGIEVGGLNYSNNASGDLEQIIGSITSYTEEGDCIFIEWDGDVANVHVHVVYRLIKTELYYTTEVTLTNTGGTDLTDVYYYRNLDPDNNVTIGGGYATQNSIVAQPTPSCEKALVTATQTGPWASYMGLGAIGENFRVSYGGFTNRDASNIWNGIGFTNTVGSSAFVDQAISIAYKVSTLAVGVPEKFLYTVVLDASQIDAAIASLYYFDYVGGGGVIDECSPVVDTAFTCAGNPVTLTVDGPSAEDYVWTWAPPIGLSTTDGPTTDASPLVTTEYTVTGTPAPLCLSATIEKTIVVVVTPSPVIEIIDPGPECGDFDLTTLEVNNLEGSPFDLSFYSIVPDSIDQIIGLWPTDFMTPGDTVYILMVNSETGCYDVAPFVVDFSGDAEAGEDNTATLCNDAGASLDLNTLLVGADPAGLWVETSPILSGGFDDLTGNLTAGGVDAGVYTFEYIALGLPPCENDTAVMTITINQEALAGLDAAISLCNTDGTTVDLNDLLDGNNAVGVWLETTGSGQFTPGTGVFDASGLAAGDYLFTYTVTALAPCEPDIANFTVTVLPNPIIDAGEDFAICIGDEASLFGSGAGIGGAYVWDGGVTDGVPFIPAGTAVYTVIGTDANGCMNTDDIEITVNPLPIIDAGEDYAICDGDETTLTGSGAGLGGTYLWLGGVINGAPFTPIATDTYEVTGTDSNGCSNMDEVTITVNPLPVIDAGTDFEICLGDTLTLSGAGAGVGGSYIWDLGVTDGFAFSPVETATYTVIGTDANGCTNMDMVEVIVKPLPIINAGDDFAICAGDEVTLIGDGAGVGGMYAWDGGVTNGVPFIPAGTAVYTLTGTDANGCINTDDIEITVNPLPIISAGEDYAICDGDETILIGTGAGLGGIYTWTGGVINAAPFTPIATATYSVTGTDANGCLNSDEVTITVNPLPGIDAGTDFAICIGETITLSGIGAGVEGSYTWDLGVTDGLAFCPLETATYTVIGTDGNGCVNTDMIEVTVNLLPIVEAGEPVEVCEEGMVALSGSGAGVGALYLWDGGGVDGVAFVATETAMFTVTGTDANGCVNTDSVWVIVNELPTINAGPDQSLCLGDEATLTASGAGIEGVYVWDGGVVNGVPYSPVATTTYTVTGTDDSGCANSDNVTVTVIPLPVIDAGSDLVICQGDVVVLNGTGAGYGGSYAWDGGVTNGMAFTPWGTTTYQVTGTTTDGCSNTDEVVVTVNILPIISFIADPLMGCAPLQVEFTSYTEGISYGWDFGDGTNSSADDPMHVYSYTGLYDVTLTVTDSNGCSDEITYNSYIDVTETPIAQFSYAPDVITVNDTKVQFTNSSMYADTYEWTFGDGGTEMGEENPEHEYPFVGNISYTVTLTAINDNGCEDVTEQILPIEDALLFYIPNVFTPDGDMYNEMFFPVFVSGLDIYDYHLMLFNRWGELVFESYDANYGWNGSYGGGELVDDGVYIWKMEFGETMSDKRHYVDGHVTVIK